MTILNILFIYLKEELHREGEIRERAAVCWLLPKGQARWGCDEVQSPELCAGLPVWMARVQTLGSSAAFPGMLTGSWNAHRAAGSWIGAHTGCWHFRMAAAMYCATTWVPCSFVFIWNSMFIWLCNLFKTLSCCKVESLCPLNNSSLFHSTSGLAQTSALSVQPASLGTCTSGSMEHVAAPDELQHSA